MTSSKFKTFLHQNTLSKEPKGNPFESKDWDSYLYTHIQAALFTIAKMWKQANCPSTDKQNMIFAYSRISFSLKMKGNSDIGFNIKTLSQVK